MKAEIDMIRRVHSYVIAAAIWGIPGINITVKGVKTYMLMDSACNHDGLRNHTEHIPDVPMSFTASFYSGIGPMLIVAALRYAIKPIDKK